MNPPNKIVLPLIKGILHHAPYVDENGVVRTHLDDLMESWAFDDRWEKKLGVDDDK